MYNNITELIGGTPMVMLNKINDGTANVALKLEYFNPSGSVKDRPALSMLQDAKNKGIINENTVIIEPTSGNTGIGLAMCCAVSGNRIILTMPESMSLERRKMLQAYGAELVLTPKEQGMQGAVNRALELSQEFPNSFIPSQFDNPANPKTHYEATAEEIWADTGGEIDIFVTSFGTGGTISGAGSRLKELNPEIKIIGIEPADSPLITEGHAGPHTIQGIGANFVPGNLDLDVLDKVLTITEKEAIGTARNLAQKEGIFCGISSGANVAAALRLSRMRENKGKLIVTVITDFGERYLSTKLLEEV
jgi:cysteine synthase A